jgi:hypothetical protein
MKKIFIATLCVAPTASVNNGYINDPRLSLKKISFFTRTQKDNESIGNFLRSLKEFLYEQGLYDAVRVVTDIERGLTENHTAKLD